MSHQGRGRPVKWKRDPITNKYLRDANGDYIPFDAPDEPKGEYEPKGEEAPKPYQGENDIPASYTHTRYASVWDYVEAAQTGPVLFSGNQSHVDGKMAQKESEWYGFSASKGMRDIVGIVKDGWSDGASRLFDAASKVSKPVMESLSRKRVWADQGESINLDRLYSGDLDTMWQGWRRKRQPKQGRVVKLGCNVAATGSTSTETMFWTGAAIVVLADVLTKAGYSVEVALYNTATQGDSKPLAEVVVKQPDQHLSITSLASTICMPGFFRSVGITWLCRQYTEQTNAGHGICDFKFRDPSCTAFVAIGEVKDAAGAIQWVNKRVEELA
ncbi:hypothetical protein UFOVP28_19 [uncultured Caudovirales phage]|uniref:DUF7192 domain-containing protein n=1 Tax=uncultured Caudovirales phage TaxID=2100421 RepID=A0A6J5KRB2_9CAUD|nr:hypothetical protein UFOVP28_19 [uncultured Caudovirales phage]